MSNALRRRPKVRKPSRVNLQVSMPQPTNPILITDAVVAGPALTLTFDQIVTLKGLPAFSVDIAGSVVSATQPAPNIVEIVFSQAITGATTVNVGFRDPAIRSASGGYVVATSHVFA